MKKEYDLSALDWTVTGWTPYLWRLHRSMETGREVGAEVPAVPTRVPGSVQGALRDAGILPDWNVGLNARTCEWVENRHWVYATRLPDAWLAAEGTAFRLRCLGLDYSGWIFANGQEVGRFTGSLIPHTFDLTPYLRPSDNTLHIVFDCPPRWLGQFGYISRMTAWKSRFNYTWDWIPRLVQLGIWDTISLVATDGREIERFQCRALADPTNGTGILHMRVGVTLPDGQIRLSLWDGKACLRSDSVSAALCASGLHWEDLPVALWWPNGLGDHLLYMLRCELLDTDGQVLDTVERRVGFRNVTWAPCEGAPPEADPWICVVNGRPVFLQGVNWTPVRPNFADVTAEEYRERLERYRDLGCNLLRVWGGAALETSIFYDLCDELGLMVWQEFPLSSSGIDNWPPEDAQSIDALSDIARSYIERRQHHASLIIWCGGNELQGDLSGSKVGTGKPVDNSHPLMQRFAAIVAHDDPEQRFLPTSSSGPRFEADESDFGKGLHWDVHGPWRPEGRLDEEWTRYWQHDDALFRSETGAPGASDADLIRAFRGEYAEVPGTASNPLWNRTSWWIEWPEFLREHGREPHDLEEYVSWSQTRQARALSIAARACKRRFPRCGGFLIWMGHDSFPCTANTSILDFYGRPKPAAEALARIFASDPSDL